MSQAVTLPEAAIHAALSVKTLRTHIKQGRLAASRPGGRYRIRLNDIDRLYGRDELAAELTGNPKSKYRDLTQPTQSRIDRIIAITTMRGKS